MSLPLILTASATLENANLVALGINHAYDTPPETLVGANLPISVRFAEPTAQMSASRLLGRYNIYHFNIEVHFARGVLQESVANVLPIIRAYQDLYANNLSILTTCDVSGFREPACTGPIVLRYRPGDKATTIGIIFHMWAKEMLDPITVNL